MCVYIYSHLEPEWECGIGETHSVVSDSPPPLAQRKLGCEPRVQRFHHQLDGHRGRPREDEPAVARTEDARCSLERRDLEARAQL